MNILLISQCSKKALHETRRILDQFAERRGDRTWQTPITQQGLATLYRLLRKTARRNTAVACHWIRGKDQSELLWIVGNAREFNIQGASPTHSTQRDILGRYAENDWHTGEDIRLLASLAALFHDFGKASDAFQKKLQSAQPIADPFRHEWISLRLFEAFVGEHCQDDRDWLERLLNPPENQSTLVLAALKKEGEEEEPGNKEKKKKEFPSPFKTLQNLPLARAVGWLIVSHHRLPSFETVPTPRLEALPRAIDHKWCGSRIAEVKTEPETERKAKAKAVAACWRFSKGLPFDSQHWREHACRVAGKLLQRAGLYGDCGAELLVNPYVLHLARLALILADHHYSAQPSQARYGDHPARSQMLFANSVRLAGENPAFNQRLDEHLIGVEVNAGRLVRALPRLEETLPRIARHKGFRQPGTGAYRWQNAAFDLAERLRAQSAEAGFFGVNLASTGCGKTLANGRILYGLANPQQGARFTLALGLRTLTLQTGEAYEQRLGLGPEDLAILVGGAAVRQLHAQDKDKAATSAHEAAGRESAEALLEPHDYVRYEGSLEEGPLKHWLYGRPSETGDAGEGEPGSAGTGKGRQRGQQAIALLDAPLLVCTVDHLVPATESTRGGRHILPMLRLMTSDLVLDEIDDFDLADLPALTRLVHWAGLLGSRVLLSSATLPPALVQGLFLAYASGRQAFQRNRGRQGERLAIPCAWFDEFGAESAEHGDVGTGADFLASHHAFVDRRIERLAKTEQVRRRAEIIPVAIDLLHIKDKAESQQKIGAAWAALCREQAFRLHRQHHTLDPKTGKRVSFGLIRMANIDPLVEVALALFQQGQQEPSDGQRIHLCPYHAQHPLLVRFGLEKTLDTTLKRHDPLAVFTQPDIRERLDCDGVEDHLFIVLATAVAEVGRDHDYDWAVVEPSSMRSIIQLAGRVWRHRPIALPAGHSNIALLETNIKHLQSGPGVAVFLRPGFENETEPLKCHRLGELLVPEQWQQIDARPRLKPRAELTPERNLVDLEHARLMSLMLGAQTGSAQERPVHLWWTTQAHLSGILQRKTPFRRDSSQRQTFVLLPDEEGRSSVFHQQSEGPWGVQVNQANLLCCLPDHEVTENPNVQVWAVPDYLPALQTLAEALGMEIEACARQFGTVDLHAFKEQATTWRYHPSLGFSRWWR